MKEDKTGKHQANIVDQFSRQAVPFSQQPAHSQEAFINLLLEMSGVGAQDTVLDVACGPGLVATAFAAKAKHVTGIDLTPAMIERARQIQEEKGLTNMSWQIGTVLPLPYPEAVIFPGDHPLFFSSFSGAPGGIHRNGAGLYAGRQGPGGGCDYAAGKKGVSGPRGKIAGPLPHPHPDAGRVLPDGRGLCICKKSRPSFSGAKGI